MLADSSAFTFADSALKLFADTAIFFGDRSVGRIGHRKAVAVALVIDAVVKEVFVSSGENAPGCVGQGRELGADAGVGGVGVIGLRRGRVGRGRGIVGRLGVGVDDWRRGGPPIALGNQSSDGDASGKGNPRAGMVAVAGLVVAASGGVSVGAGGARQKKKKGESCRGQKLFHGNLLVCIRSITP